MPLTFRLLRSSACQKAKLRRCSSARMGSTSSIASRRGFSHLQVLESRELLVLARSTHPSNSDCGCVHLGVVGVRARDAVRVVLVMVMVCECECESEYCVVCVCACVHVHLYLCLCVCVCDCVLVVVVVVVCKCALVCCAYGVCVHLCMFVCICVCVSHTRSGQLAETAPC